MTATVFLPTKRYTSTEFQVSGGRGRGRKRWFCLHDFRTFAKCTKVATVQQFRVNKFSMSEDLNYVQMHKSTVHVPTSIGKTNSSKEGRHNCWLYSTTLILRKTWVFCNVGSVHLCFVPIVEGMRTCYKIWHQSTGLLAITQLNNDAFKIIVSNLEMKEETRDLVCQVGSIGMLMKSIPLIKS